VQSLFVQVGLTQLPNCSCGDHEPHCGLLPTNQVRRWTDDSTWCWSRSVNWLNSVATTSLVK